MIIDSFMCREYTLAMAKKAIEQNVQVTNVKVQYLDYDDPAIVVTFRASRGFEARDFKNSIKTFKEFIS